MKKEKSGWVVVGGRVNSHSSGPCYVYRVPTVQFITYFNLFSSVAAIDKDVTRAWNQTTHNAAVPCSQ